MQINKDTPITQLQTYCGLEGWYQKDLNKPIPVIIYQIVIMKHSIHVVVFMEGFTYNYEPNLIYLNKTEAINVYNNNLEKEKIK